jgi:hypothetical protein
MEEVLAGRAEVGPFPVDIFYFCGGVHDAKPVPAVYKAEAMTQFM